MNDRADQAAHSAHIEGRDLRDEVDAIVSAALPATPEAGEVDPARVRAALTALAVQRAGHGLGNINNAIYTHSSAFTDVLNTRQGSPSIISGDLSTNRMFDYNGDGLRVSWDAVPGWDTTAGYDMTTGFGTPNAPAYVAALAGP